MLLEINYNSISQIIIFVPVIMLFYVNHKGMLYDAMQEKFNGNNKSYHSISFRHGKFWLALPLWIFAKSDHPQIENAKSGYNRSSMIFWMLTIATIILYKSLN